MPEPISVRESPTQSILEQQSAHLLDTIEEQAEVIPAFVTLRYPSTLGR
jgi:hypothetical protein